MKKILFLCTHNSARSILAQAICNHFFKNNFIAYSAGTEKTKVKPQAIVALKNAKIPVDNLFSKTIYELACSKFDIIVTLCDSAKTTCPFFPGDIVIHKSFLDPSNCIDDLKQKCFDDTLKKIKNWLQTFLPKYY